MPLYMDVHRGISDINSNALAQAHEQDLKIQDQYGVKYLRYWFDDKEGTVFCLCEAPNKEAAAKVHEQSHGLVADEIFEVMEGN